MHGPSYACAGDRMVLSIYRLNRKCTLPAGCIFFISLGGGGGGGVKGDNTFINSIFKRSSSLQLRFGDNQIS